MKLKEFYNSPAGEITTGLIEGLAITGAALGLCTLIGDDWSYPVIGAVAIYAMGADSLPRIGAGIWDAVDNAKTRKYQSKF